jgi:hypothetical protein
MAGIEALESRTMLTVPIAPTLAVATPVSSLWVGLQWQDNSTDETSFNIYRRISTGPDVWQVVASVDANTTSWVDPVQRTAGGTYSYEVTAVNASGESAPTNIASVTLPSLPASPSSATATAASSLFAQVQWQDSAGDETGFRIYRETSASPVTWTIEASVDASTISWLDPTQWSPGTALLYRVTAVNGAGESAPATAAQLTLPSLPASPTSVTATASSSLFAQVQWQDSTGDATGFRVYRETSAAPVAWTVEAVVDAGTTSWLDPTQWSPGTSLLYRVTAVNGDGESAPAAAPKLTLPSTPASPSNAAATAVSSWFAKVQWQDNSSNETGFTIYQRVSQSPDVWQVAGLVQANTTTWSDPTQRTPGATYAYRVTATNGAGESAPSNTAQVTLPSAPLVPSAPSNLTVTPYSSLWAQLQWQDNSINETGFNIYRLISQSPDVWQVEGVVGAGITTWVDPTQWAPEQTLTYRVTAANAAGESTPTAAVPVTLPVPPASPSNLTATVLYSQWIQLQWSDNSTSETGFKIYQLVSQNPDVWQVQALVQANTTTWSDPTQRTPGATYSYRVTATSGAGESSPSNTAQVTLPTTASLLPAAPSNLVVTTVSSLWAQLQWQDNSTNETGFRIYRLVSQNPDVWQIEGMVDANTTTWLDPTQRNPGETLAYSVTAVDAAGESTTSNVAQVTLPVAPASPSNVTATVVSASWVNVQWQDNSSDETGFRIYRLASQNPDVWQVEGLVEANTTSWLDPTQRTAGATYPYRVTAVSPAGESAPSNTAQVTIPTAAASLPAAASNLTVTAVTPTQDHLQWQDNSNTETGFLVYLLTNRAPDLWAVAATVGPNVTSWQSSVPRIPGLTYWYYVAPYNDAGVAYPSNVAQVTMPPAISIMDDGDRGFTITGKWTRATGQGYNSDILYHAGKGTDTAKWTFTGLLPGVYRVSATWPAKSDRATNASFSVFNGTTKLSTVAVNQRLTPGDLILAGSRWKDLGASFSITGTTLAASLADAGANGTVVADAIRIEWLGSLPAGALARTATRAVAKTPPAFSVTAISPAAPSLVAPMVSDRSLSGFFAVGPVKSDSDLPALMA